MLARVDLWIALIVVGAALLFLGLRFFGRSQKNIEPKREVVVKGALARGVEAAQKKRAKDREVGQ